MNAVLLVSHGSRYEKTVREVERTARALEERGNGFFCRYAFLELQRPTIPEGLQACVDAGAHRVMVLLNFLNAGQHVDKDIPAIVRAAAKRYPHVRFVLSPPVGRHPDLAGIFLDMIGAMEDDRGPA